MNLNHYFNSLIANCRSIFLTIKCDKYSPIKKLFVYATPLATDPHETLGNKVQIMISVRKMYKDIKSDEFENLGINTYKTDRSLFSILKDIGDIVENHYDLDSTERIQSYKTIIL